MGIFDFLKGKASEETTRGESVYEVGSPEYNAQVIAMIHQVNEELAKRGKLVPERVALEIILERD